MEALRSFLIQYDPTTLHWVIFVTVVVFIVLTLIVWGFSGRIKAYPMSVLAVLTLFLLAVSYDNTTTIPRGAVVFINNEPAVRLTNSVRGQRLWRFSPTLENTEILRPVKPGWELLIEDQSRTFQILVREIGPEGVAGYPMMTSFRVGETLENNGYTVLMSGTAIP